MADGWAYRNMAGKISVATVSPTERAAQVNLLALATTRMPLDSDTDEQIATMTKALLREIGGDIVPVTIKLKVH